ncbi:MAG: glycosyltransferase family 2 protein, partial [Bacilli bacterium]
VVSVSASYYNYLFNRPGSTIERRSGIGAFDLYKSYSQLISSMTEDEKSKYGDYVLIKLLGDFDYNRKFLSENLLTDFKLALFYFVKNNFSSIKDENIFSPYKKDLFYKSKNSPDSDIFKRFSFEDDISFDFSIIIPSHNVEGFLEKSLGACACIEGSLCEVILIDDGSRDKTVQKATEYLKIIDNYKIISISEATGSPGTPRNVGVVSALGKYIVFLDADDSIDATNLVSLVNKTKVNNLDIGISTSFNRDECGVSKNIKLYYFQGDKNISVRKLFDTPYFSNIWNRVYKKSFLIKNNVFFPDMYISEDMLFSIKSLLSGAKFTVLEGCHYNYNYNRPLSTTSQRVGVKGFSVFENSHSIIKYIKSINPENLNENMDLVENRLSGSIKYTYSRLEDNLKLDFEKKYKKFQSLLKKELDIEMRDI